MNSTVDLQVAEAAEMAPGCVAAWELATSWIWLSNRYSAPCSRRKAIRKNPTRHSRGSSATWEWIKSWRIFQLNVRKN